MLLVISRFASPSCAYTVVPFFACLLHPKQHTANPYHTFPIDENCFYVHTQLALHRFRFFPPSEIPLEKFIVSIFSPSLAVRCTPSSYQKRLNDEDAGRREERGGIEDRFIIIFIAFQTEICELHRRENKNRSTMIRFLPITRLFPSLLSSCRRTGKAGENESEGIMIWKKWMIA